MIRRFAAELLVKMKLNIRENKRLYCLQPTQELCSFYFAISLLAIDWVKILDWLKNWKKHTAQATVETSLQNVRVLLKSPNFSKSQVIDGLLPLKLISK